MHALILVDIQNDFLPGGALAVKDGDQIIPYVNAIMDDFDIVVATQDWHPKDHGSFSSNHKGKKIGEVIKLEGLDQIMWPDHCIQHSKGAEFSRDLDLHRVQMIFHKGTDPKIDSYSGLFDNGYLKSTGLGEYLKGEGVTDMTCVGLAADYCLKFTALDAVSKFGFNTHVPVKGTKAVNLQPNDFERSIEVMRDAGIKIM